VALCLLVRVSASKPVTQPIERCPSASPVQAHARSVGWEVRNPPKELVLMRADCATLSCRISASACMSIALRKLIIFRTRFLCQKQNVPIRRLSPSGGHFLPYSLTQVKLGSPPVPFERRMGVDMTFLNHSSRGRTSQSPFGRAHFCPLNGCIDSPLRRQPLEEGKHGTEVHKRWPYSLVEIGALLAPLQPSRTIVRYRHATVVAPRIDFI
jgi:hypothetical protein